MRSDPNRTDAGWSATGAMAAGIVLGAAVGAVVALLYAPRAGAATRALLAQRADHIRRHASSALDDFGDEARVLAHRGGLRARRALRRARLAATDAVSG